jgi:hypothetical protein
MEPSSALADLIVGILQRGVVLVLKLEGPPGDRHLTVGLGLAESTDTLLLALGLTTGAFGSGYDADGWME